MTDIEDTLNKIWTGQEQLAETLKQLEIGQAQQQREASMPEPVRVFVSYAHQDHAFAKRLVGDLKAAGAEVWWDVTGINEGDFLKKINDALQNCEWCVLVLTPDAIASRWVSMEVNAAIHRREQGFMKGVLPVLAAPTEPRTIPPLWGTQHRYNAVADYDGEVKRLQRTLGLTSITLAAPPPVRTLSLEDLTNELLALPTEPLIGSTSLPPDQFPDSMRKLGFMPRVRGDTVFIHPPWQPVQAGEFLMGTDRRKEIFVYRVELPQHTVNLSPFRIARYPVTVAEYRCFVKAGKKEPDNWREQLAHVDHPVTNINHYDAVAYAHWLAGLTKEDWRLPTEAEWEKAARGTDGRIYPWGDEFDPARCNSSENGPHTTTPVGAYPSGASPYEAQDMTGNVFEWTSSLFYPYPYSGTDGRERADLPESRVLRGGSWSSDARQVRAAFRYFSSPDASMNFIGFRIARSA